MSYISGSEGPSVSGYDVQGPKKLPDSAFAKAVQASSSVVLETPDKVIIQGNGNYTFKYDCSDSVGSGVALGKRVIVILAIMFSYCYVQKF